MSTTRESCALCGTDQGDRVMALVEWTEPIGKTLWSHVPRCVDRVTCRDRVERVLAEPWPVNDGTPAPDRPPSLPKSRPGAEPLGVAPARSAAAPGVTAAGDGDQADGASAESERAIASATPGRTPPADEEEISWLRA